MASFVRIRRLHRTPLRIGSVNITNAQVGSLVNTDDPKVKRDMKNAYDRWVFVDRYDSPRVAANATQVEQNFAIGDATTDGTAVFGATTGGKEYAVVVNLPAGFTVTNVTVFPTSVSGTTSHLWCTIATYDGSTNLTYQAVTADTTSGTVSLTAPLTFNPVVSAGVPYVTPYEGQYVVTISHTAGTTAAGLASTVFPAAYVANQLAAPIPQNLNTYGNPVTNALVNPWAASTSSNTVTTPPTVGSTNAVGTNFATASAKVAYVQVS